MVRYRFLAVLLLFVLAAVPRFCGLGNLGFSGDEELTAFASKSLRDGGRAEMPSGLAYNRALPYTFLNAATLRLFSEEEESSYRWVSALFGTATVPLTFLGAAPVLGWPTAFSGALLLAVSEQHIHMSRTARMYSPFLFFFLLATLVAWQWGRKGDRRLMVLSLLSAVFAATLHQLALLLAFSAYLPMLLFPGFFSRVRARSILVASLVLGASSACFESMLSIAAKSGALRPELAVSLPGTAMNLSNIIARTSILIDGAVLAVIGAAVGGCLGFWLAKKSLSLTPARPTPWETLWSFFTGMFGGALVGIGFLYGAAMFLLLFLVPHRVSAGQIIRANRVPLLLLVGLSLVTLFLDSSAIFDLEALKRALFFPFPLALYYGQGFPGISILFAAGVVISVMKSRPSDAGIQVTILAVLIPFLILGVLTEWTPFRYTAGAYPFFLLGSAWGALALIQRGLRRFEASRGRLSVLVLSLVVLSGLLGGHGLPQSLEAASSSHRVARTGITQPGWEAYPDHKSAGEYVRLHLQVGDVVMAEDATMQAWYVGKVDFWLRDPRNHARYTYLDSQGQQRDLYTDAQLATPNRLESICAESSGRVWVITSGETSGQWQYYLDSNQQEWLVNLMSHQEAEFRGRDGLTEVYRIDCTGGSSTPI